MADESADESADKSADELADEWNNSVKGEARLPSRAKARFRVRRWRRRPRKGGAAMARRKAVNLFTGLRQAAPQPSQTALRPVGFRVEMFFSWAGLGNTSLPK